MDYPVLALDPQQRRQETLEALTSQVEALSRQKPVLMILEDAHWADPTAMEAFSRAVDRTRTFGLLLIVTYRPEFEPPWTGRSNVTVLALNRLGECEIAAMIDGVTGNKPLPASIRRDIIERTDGIPLFVEEMTKAVLEAGSESASKQTAAAVPSPALAVPASLHASLMARLDRLGSAKEVAQIGAVIGREFPHALIAAVARKEEAQLRSALDRLIDAGLLFRQGAAPHATYLFKHALVQDVAYGTLLREARRALHARIAETLESQFAWIDVVELGRLCRLPNYAGRACFPRRPGWPMCSAKSLTSRRVGLPNCCRGIGSNQSASGRLIRSRYAAVLGVGFRIKYRVLFVPVCDKPPPRRLLAVLRELAREYKAFLSGDAAKREH
jgi:hypothetical protein